MHTEKTDFLRFYPTQRPLLVIIVDSTSKLRLRAKIEQSLRILKKSLKPVKSVYYFSEKPLAAMTWRYHRALSLGMRFCV